MTKNTSKHDNGNEIKIRKLATKFTLSKMYTIRDSIGVSSYKSRRLRAYNNMRIVYGVWG